MGHINWSPLAVSEAMAQAEKDLEPIFEHLDRAYQTVKEAEKLPNLPQYMKQSIVGLKYEVDRVRRHTDTDRYGTEHRGGLLNAIDRVRGDLPKENLKAEKEIAKAGKPLRLGEV